MSNLIKHMQQISCHIRFIFRNKANIMFREVGIAKIPRPEYGVHDNFITLITCFLRVIL